MGKSGTKTTYSQAPEQRAIFSALLPMINQMAGLGISQLGEPGMGMPMAPTAPSMSGVLTGVSPYEIPSTSRLMPSQEWYDSMSPEVKAGVWAPYQEGAQQLEEQLGSIGALGSPRGGVSGSAAAGLGNYWSKASPQAALSMWGMTQPGLQAGWQAELARNMGGYQQGLTEAGTDYNNILKQQQQDYAMQQTAWGLPWSLTGMTPSTFSNPITTTPSSGLGGMGTAAGMLGGAGLGWALAPATGGLSALAYPAVGAMLGGAFGGSLFG